MHTVAVFGLTDALAWENIRLVAIESRWGARWLIQCYTALALVGASFMIRGPRWRFAWPAYACAVLMLCAVTPLLGHAAGSPSRHAMHAVHLVAGSVWLGSLAVLVAIRLMGVAVAPSAVVAHATPPLETGFSSIALTAAALVGSSGLATAWLYLGASDNLFSTTYGRLLMVKVACVCAVVACGWRNWQRVRVGAEPSTGVMSAEVAFAFAVVVATSVLTETEHP